MEDKLIGQIKLDLSELKKQITDINKLLGKINDGKETIDIDLNIKRSNVVDQYVTQIKQLTKAGKDAGMVIKSVKDNLETVTKINSKGVSFVSQETLNTSKKFKAEFNTILSIFDKLSIAEKNNSLHIEETIKAYKNLRNQYALGTDEYARANKEMARLDSLKTKAVAREADESIKNLIGQYNAQKIGYNDFMAKGVSMYNTPEFNKASLETQISLTKALTRAEQDHTKELQQQASVKKTVQDINDVKPLKDAKLAYAELTKEQQRLPDNMRPLIAQYDELIAKYRLEGREIGQLVAERSRLNSSLITNNKNIQKARIEYDLLVKKYQESANASFMGSGDARAGVTQKIFNSAIYSASGYAMGQLGQAMTGLININKDFETGLIDLSRTMGNVSERDMQMLGKSAIELSRNYGVAIKETQNAMTELARAGIDDPKTLTQMSESVMLGLNTTEIKDAEQMVGYLVSTVKQLGLEYSDTNRIIDQWNYLADKYAVKTNDFAEATQKAGASSKGLGIDLETLNSMVVVLGERTQASGREIGNAIKTLESYIVRPKTVEKLEGYGIVVKKNADEFKSFAEMMQAVDEKLNTLTDDSVVANDILQTLGGAWRRNWVSVLANDWEEIDKVKSNIANSTDWSIKENEKIMGTFAKQLEQLKVAFSSLGLAIGNAGLINEVRFLVDMIKGLADVIAKIPAPVMETILIMTNLRLVFGALQLVVKQMTGITIGNWIAKTGLEMKSLGIVAKATTLSFEQFAIGEKIVQTALTANIITVAEYNAILAALAAGHRTAGLSAQANAVQENAFGIALKRTAAVSVGSRIASFAAPLLLTVAISAAIEGIMMLIDKSKEAENSVKSLSETMSNIQEIKAQTDSVIDLRDELVSLTTKAQQVDLNAAEQKRLKEVQDELIKQIPQLQGMFESEMAGYKAVNEVIDQQIAKLKEKKQIETDAVIGKAPAEFTKIANKLKEDLDKGIQISETGTTKAPNLFDQLFSDKYRDKKAELDRIKNEYLPLIRDINENDTSLKNRMITDTFINRERKDYNNELPYLKFNESLADYKIRVSKELKERSEVLISEITQNLADNKIAIKKDEEDLIAALATITPVLIDEKIAKDKLIVSKSQKALTETIIKSWSELNKGKLTQGSPLAETSSVIDAILPIIKNSDIDERTQQYNKLTKKYLEGSINKRDFDTQAKKIKDDYLESISNAFENLPSDKKEAIKNVIKNLFPDASLLDDTNQSLKVMMVDQDLYKSVVEDSTATLIEYNNMLYKVRNEKYYTGVEILELIKKYPKLRNAVIKTNEGYLLQEQAVKDLRQAHVDKMNTTINAENVITQITMAQTQSRLKYYGAELESIKSLADAQALIADIKTQPTRLATAKAEEWGVSDADSQQMEQWAREEDERINGTNSVLFKQLELYGDIQDRLKQIKEITIDENLGVDPPKDTGGGGDRDERNSAKKPYALLETDRYMRLNLELEKTNNLIAENKALQELNKDDLNETNKLMEIEIGLLVRKQQNIHDIAEEQRKERDELAESLAWDKMTFSGEGDNMLADNAQAILDAQRKLVDAHRADKDSTEYDRQKEIYDDLLARYKRFVELQVKSIPELQQKYLELQKDINAVNNELIQVRIKIEFKHMDKANEEFDEFMKGLDLDEKLAGKNKQKIIEIQNDKMEALTSNIIRNSKELEALNKITDKNILKDAEFIQKKKDLASVIQGNIEALYDLRHTQSEAANTIESSEKRIISIIEKGVELRKKALDKELDNYKKYVDKIIQERERRDETDDYNKKIAKLLSERQLIQNKINKLALDNSIESKQKTRELQKDLKEKDNDILEARTERDRTLTKQNLEDSVKYKENENKKSNELLDEQFSTANKKVIAQEILITKSFKSISDKLPELFEELGVGTDEFFKTFEQYEVKFGETIFNIAKKFKDEILPEIMAAIEALKNAGEKAKTITGNTPSTSSKSPFETVPQQTIKEGTKKPTQPPKSDVKQITIQPNQAQSTISTNKKADDAIKTGRDAVQSILPKKPISQYTPYDIVLAKNKMAIGKIQREWNTTNDPDEKAKLAKDAQNIRDMYGDQQQEIFGGTNWDLRGYKPPSDMVFAKGINNGLATKTGMYLLHGSENNPEWILTNAQMYNFVKGLANSLRVEPPTANNIDSNINLHINIMGNADDTTVSNIKDAGKQIMTDLKKELNKVGIYK